MKYPHILASFYSSPWAILPEKYREIEAFLHRKARGEQIDPQTIQAATSSRRPANVQVTGGTAVLPIFGVIMQRISAMEEMSGGVSTEVVGATLDNLMSDRDVRRIVLVIDSPGGSVFGVQELGDKIRGYREQKKIVAVADSLAASAAYWLAAQASELYVTPGGQVGSIGVFISHADLTQAEKDAGLKTTLVSAGEYKVEMASSQTLSPEAKAELQSKVDFYYDAFVAAVASGRRVSYSSVVSDFGKGRMMTAPRAKGVGTVDGIHTLQQVFEKLGASGGSTAKAGHVSPAMAAARLRVMELEG